MLVSSVVFLPRFLGILSTLSDLWARKHTEEPGRCGCPPRQRIPGVRDRGSQPPCARVPSRTRLVLLPLWIFFSAPAQVPYHAADRRLTHPHSRQSEQELGPLRVGGPRPLLDVF